MKGILEKSLQMEDEALLDWFAQKITAAAVEGSATAERRLASLLSSAANLMTPGELQSLYWKLRKEKESLEKTGMKRIGQAAPLWNRLRNKGVPEFRREPLSPCVCLYSRPDLTQSSRRLIVLFAGRTGNPFMPMARFLYLIEAPDIDVLFLRRDSYGADFLCGLPDHGASLFALCQDLKRRTAMAEYRTVSTLGISFGGCAALGAARFLEADRGVSVSGRSPPLVEAISLTKSPLAFDPVCSCSIPASSRQPALYGIYSPSVAPDASFAERLRTLPDSVHLLRIDAFRSHNLFAHLHAQNSLGDFLSWVASPEVGTNAASLI